MDRELRLLAPAKINLSLEVLGRRADGFHEVRTVLQKVDLADELIMSSRADLTFWCDVAELSNQDNLVLEAARRLRWEAGVTVGAHIELRKHIPVAAGLGGGSSDAAACLLGLSRLWDLSFPSTRLAQTAASMGSDVPFFLDGGTALATGRGEMITPLPPLVNQWFVLLVPPLTLPNKTETLYKMLTSVDFTSGETTRALVRRLRKSAGLDPALLHNIFKDVAQKAFPGLDSYQRQLQEAGGDPVHLCGSGPTLYAPVASAEVGGRVVERLRQRGFNALLVRTLP